ncbi:hypothetical protein JMJ77_0003827 [Colletotrichum scovillei]|uniref:Uncharacterized protein n=1 Tax=Colletotrichum scovillei TaxID=1209932 RepID=A0A9P7U8I1_9PEZI|nr:hypothetical protein JMJ77_0003827 [Colletotrichum scovillei]KAG7049075.1 hypothetical protein JMJ78_0013058 [Colletotrichum scovillei]KAG7063817.1 hypothetical protein JMJ76_0006865 [Colletotrichum scovillei]
MPASILGWPRLSLSCICLFPLLCLCLCLYHTHSGTSPPRASGSRMYHLKLHVHRETF